MSRIVNAPSFGYCTSNIGTGTPTTTPGTNFNCNASNAYGTVAQIFSALTHDVEFLILGFAGINSAGANGSASCQILVDRAGGTTWDTTNPIITNLLVGQTIAAGQSVPTPLWYVFPLWIPAGASVAVRGMTAHTSNITSGRVIAHAYGGNTNPGGWWCGQRVETIGVTNSQGTNHTPGASGTYSAWTNFGSTTTRLGGAVQFRVQGTTTDLTQASNVHWYEFGIGSQRIGPPVFYASSTNENGWSTLQGAIFRSIPAGSQFMCRGTSNVVAGSTEIHDVAAYVVY
jgi:hypothetical protein